MKRIKKLITNTPEETKKVAGDFAKNLCGGTIVGLIGPLGSGKTIFTQGIAKGLKIKEPVTSPSFTILNIYEAPRINLFHFDLYRIDSIQDLENIGYEEYFFSGHITIIEWAEKCIDILPKNSYLLYFKYLNEKEREITICQK